METLSFVGPLLEDQAADLWSGILPCQVRRQVRTCPTGVFSKLK